MEKLNGYQKMLKELNIDQNTFFEIVFNNIIGLNDKLYKEEVKKISKILLSNPKEEIFYRKRHQEQNNKKIDHYKNIRNEIFGKNKCSAQSDSSKIIDILITCIKVNEPKIKLDNLKKEYLQDYDLSHIWDATQNPLLYTLPWNYYFIPKMISPITDRNVRYDEKRIFLKKIMKKVIKEYSQEIEEYNKFMKENQNKIIKYYNEKILTDKEFSKNLQRLDAFKKHFFLIDTKNESNLYRKYIIE